jgi:hypothetical protein
MPIDYIARAEENMRRNFQQDAQETSTDRAVDRYVKVAKTQAAIIEEIKKMAEIMAAAAIASQQAVGDSPFVAVRNWSKVLVDETHRLIREKQKSAQSQIESGTVIDQDKT